MTHRKKVFLILLIIVFILTIIFEIPVTENFSFNTDKFNSSSVKVAFISDFHSCYYGKNQNQLIKMVDDAKPDIIIFGGDTFDDKGDNKNSMELVSILSREYPCFYAIGNHECWSKKVPELKSFMSEHNVTVLEGNSVSIEINSNIIDICGIDDPDIIGMDYWYKELCSAYSQTNPDHYRILVSHRPDLVDYYSQFDFDLILSGHAHGGQLEIPFFRIGLFAPNQGLFARYIDGTYELNSNSILLVSRGLARESIPLPRFFNSPELVVVEIT